MERGAACGSARSTSSVEGWSSSGYGTGPSDQAGEDPGVAACPAPRVPGTIVRQLAQPPARTPTCATAPQTSARSRDRREPAPATGLRCSRRRAPTGPGRQSAERVSRPVCRWRAATQASTRTVPSASSTAYTTRPCQRPSRKAGAASRCLEQPVHSAVPDPCRPGLRWGVAGPRRHGCVDFGTGTGTGAGERGTLGERQPPATRVSCRPLSPQLTALLEHVFGRRTLCTGEPACGRRLRRGG